MVMSSRGKKKTTMAKLNREARLRERRAAKQERKDARRDAAATGVHADPQTMEVEFGPQRAPDESL
jgi:hypothetical protein